MSRRTKKKKAQRAQFATDPRRAQNANVPDSQLRTQATSRRDELSRRRTLQGVLDPASASIAVRQADAGDDSRALRFYERVERDPHYLSVLETRRRRIAGIPWRLEPASDSPEDIRIAAELEALLRTPGGFRTGGDPTRSFTEMLYDLTIADARGWKALQIRWDVTPQGPWTPRFINVPYSAFQWDRPTGRLGLYNAGASPEPLEPFRWVVHRPRLGDCESWQGGLSRVVLPFYLLKSQGVKDWGVFSELFGMPIRLGLYPTNASQKQQDELYAAVMGVGADGAAIMPDTMQLQFHNAGAGGQGNAPYRDLIQLANFEISKATVGGTMIADSGSSFNQSTTMENTLLHIANHGAAEIASTAQRDVIEPAVILNYGPEVSAPRLVMHQPPMQDLGVTTQAMIGLIDRGLTVSVKDVRELLRLREPTPGEALVERQSGLGGEGNSPVPSELEAPERGGR